MKVIFSTLLCMMLFFGSAQALEGYIELDYNLLERRGEITQIRATLELWHTFRDTFTIGGALKGELAGIGFKRFVPSGIPLRQYYEGYITYHTPIDIDITISSWCWHWLSQSGVSATEDTSGLSIKMRYNF